MTDFDRPGPPSDSLPKLISVNPDEGFGPHITDSFLELYGEESVFVTATVDCLNYRFNSVIVRAGKISEDHKAVQYGEPAMREAIELLLQALGNKGLDNPPTVLLRSATGYEEPQTFLTIAGSLLGADLVSNWLGRLEQEDYVGAAALLAVH